MLAKSQTHNSVRIGQRFIYVYNGKVKALLMYEKNVKGIIDLTEKAKSYLMQENVSE